RDWSSDVCSSDLRHDQPQVLHRPGTTCTAIAHKTGGLVIPLRIEIIQGVFESARGAVAVFRRDEYIGVEAGDFVGPGFGVGLAVLTHGRWHGLIQQGQVEILDVQLPELRIGTLLRVLVGPLGDCFAVTSGTGTSKDNGDPDHDDSSLAARSRGVGKYIRGGPSPLSGTVKGEDLQWHPERSASGLNFMGRPDSNSRPIFTLINRV